MLFSSCSDACDDNAIVFVCGRQHKHLRLGAALSPPTLLLPHHHRPAHRPHRRHAIAPPRAPSEGGSRTRPQPQQTPPAARPPARRRRPPHPTEACPGRSSCSADSRRRLCSCSTAACSMNRIVASASTHSRGRALRQSCPSSSKSSPSTRFAVSPRRRRRRRLTTPLRSLPTSRGCYCYGSSASAATARRRTGSSATVAA